MKIHPQCENVPRLSAASYAGLKKELETGFDPLRPILITPDGFVLDGRHRQEICEELGISPTYQVTKDAPLEVIDRSLAGRVTENAVMPLYYAAKRGFSTKQIMQKTGCTAQIANLARELAKDEEAWKAICVERKYTLYTAMRHRRNTRSAPKKAPPAPGLVKHAESKELSAAKATQKKLLDEVLSLRTQLDAYAQMTARPLPPIERREKASGIREATAVALLSDVHYAEEVRPTQAIKNRYNPTIADYRLTRFFDGLLWLVDFNRTAFKIRDVVLWLGGDLGTGHLHPENVETSALAPIDEMFAVRDRVTAGIERLLRDGNFERVDVVCSHGNHGRTTKEMRATTGSGHSLESIVYRDLPRIGDPRLRVFDDGAMHQYHTVYDFRLHFHHGHEIRYAGGVGGVTIPANKAVAQWDQWESADYHNFGHWHQYGDYGRITMNGSTIGCNAYAMSIKATPEPPQQAFYLLDSKRGKTCKSPIWVGDKEGEAEL